MADRAIWTVSPLSGIVELNLTVDFSVACSLPALGGLFLCLPRDAGRSDCVD